MLLNTLRNTAVCCGLLLLFSVNSRADDWTQGSFDVAGGGVLTMEYPNYWGKKPKYETFDAVTDIQFGPYGPREKPFFLVHLQSFLAVDPISAKDLMEITEVEVTKLKQISFETDVPINDLQGPHNIAHYFSITDRESKRGEFDYLTMAVIASGNLLTKCYFFSSDGAPDFGADAMQMMQSIKYTAPVPKPDKK